MKPPKNPIATLEIEYIDGAGRKSKRIIDIPDAYAVDGVWINAYCRKRSAWRSFYPDRILRCTDVISGEVVSDVIKYFERLCGARLARAKTKDWIKKPSLNSYMELVRVFCSGLLADGVLYDQEIIAMQRLFAQCPADTPPSINAVLDVLELIQEDGVITAEEHAKLLTAVQKLTD